MFHFPGQREGEKVLMVVHKHPIVYVKLMVAFAVVVVLPIILFSLFFFSAYPATEYYDASLIVGISISLYFLYGLLLACIKWIDEEFDVFIITSDRLIDVTQLSFLRRTVTSTPLEQIQDTTGEIHGFLPTILQYGNITVQTAAGDASNINIDRISDPEGVARKILDWTHRKKTGEEIR